MARGKFTEAQLHEVNDRLVALLADQRVYLDAIYYCPHLPDGDDARYAVDCACRKPKPGMIHAAAAEMGINVQESVMIGDKPSDVEAGRAAGLKTIAIERSSGSFGADHAAANLYAAIQYVRDHIL